jgi:hypothetical protein
MATKAPPETYLRYWEAAAQQEIGIEVKVDPNDQALFVNLLYDCRNTFGGYEDMMILQPNPPGTVFIRTKELAEMGE